MQKAFALLAATVGAATQYDFKPDNANLTTPYTTNLAVPWSLDESQTNHSGFGTGSYWASTYASASNGHQYLVLSHFMTGLGQVLGVQGLYRASVIDITDPASGFNQFTKLTNQSAVFASSGVIHADHGEWGFASTSDTDSVSQFRTFSTVENVGFDLTFNTSSTVVLNGGLGLFAVDDSYGFQWSVPRGQVSGTITVNGTDVEIDPEQSFTWYDRQWGSVPIKWSWFQVHLDNGAALSIWDYTTFTGQNSKFATVREEDGSTAVVPVVSVEGSAEKWTSPVTTFEYPLAYNIELEDGTKLTISAVTDDQELTDPDATLATYQGFGTVNGSYKGSKNVSGYGLLELEPQVGSF